MPKDVQRPISRTPFTVEAVCWQDAATELAGIREKVFITEQRIPRRVELDGRDEKSLHVQARLDDGTLVGTGRLLPNGHIGHIAVLLPYRGRGIGRALLSQLLELARAHGHDAVYLDCGLESICFFETLQFAAEGPVYMEAGVPHQRMVRRLVAVAFTTASRPSFNTALRLG